MKTGITLGAMFGATAVILGAFGAHALKEKLNIQQAAVFETAVKYQFYHAFALIIAGLLSGKVSASCISWSYLLFTAGILLFSGSLYLLSTIDINGLQSIKKVLGPVTPLGGLCLIAGWICLLISVRSK